MNTIKAVLSRLNDKSKLSKTELSLLNDFETSLAELEFASEGIYEATDKLNPARPSITEPLFSIVDNIYSEVSAIETFVKNVEGRLSEFQSIATEVKEAYNVLGVDAPDSVKNYQSTMEDMNDSISWGATYVNEATKLAKAIESQIYNLPV